MKIPIGNAGYQVADAAPRAQAPEAAFANNSATQIGAGVGAVGDAASQVESAQIAEKDRLDREYRAKLKQQMDEDNRSRSLLSLTQHKDGVLEAADKTTEALQQGQIKRGDAPKFYMDQVQKVREAAIVNVAPEHRELVNAQFASTEGQGGRLVDKAMDLNQKQELVGNLAAIRDNMAKLAVRPGADLAKINSDYEAAALNLGKAAGLPDDKIKKDIQDFKDGNTFNNVTAQINASSDNVRGLRSIKDAIVKGTYAETLDPQKQNALINAVDNRVLHLQNVAEAAQRRQDAAATRAVSVIEKTIASGLTVSPETWANASKATKGTAYEPIVSGLIKQERETQDLLAKPIADQVAAVNAAEAAAIKSGSLQDKANADRLKRTIGGNIQTLTQSPLVYAAQRQGANVQPLSLDNIGAWGDELKNRLTAVDPLSRDFGAPKRLLFPQEAQQMAAIVSGSDPHKALQFFAELKKSIPDAKAFRDTVMQIAPDSPVAALAGVAAGRGTQEDDKSADLMLRGLRALNPNSKTDGKPTGGKLVTMPEEKQLLQQFADYERDAYAGKPEARNAVYQAAHAIYAARMVDKGDYSGVLDQRVWKDAMQRAVGNVESYNSHAVVLPAGTDYSQFRDGVRTRVDALVAEGRLDAQSTAGRLRGLPMENVGDGRYVFKAGDGVLADKDGAPVVLDFNEPAYPPPAGGRRGPPTNFTDNGNGAATGRAAGPNVADLRADMSKVDESTWERRADGSKKGRGFLGLLKTPDGKVASEYSVGVEINGKQMDVPSLVPTLTRKEVEQTLKASSEGKFPPDSVIEKATAHARKRLAEGKSVFAGKDEGR